MGQIVVGMDGSEGAVAALRWAVKEAERRGARLLAVRAWSYLDQQQPFDPAYGQDDADIAHRDVVVAALGEDGAADVETRAVCDLPASALLTESAGADLLVVGARGLGGFGGLLLGSVSQQCLHHAKVPVAVVRPERDDDGPERVVVGVDGSENAQRALDWAVEEGRLRKAEVEAVHAWSAALLTGNPYAPAYDPNELEAAAREVLDTAIDKVDASALAVPIRRTLAPGTPSRAIVEAAADADLVVVGSRGISRLRSLVLGSVSQQVVSHAPCTVVVLPVAA